MNNDTIESNANTVLVSISSEPRELIDDKNASNAVVAFCLASAVIFKEHLKYENSSKRLKSSFKSQYMTFIRLLLPLRQMVLLVLRGRYEKSY